MKKFIVTWTFMRHVHRHREYKILTKVFDAADEGCARYMMNCHAETQAFYAKGFSNKLESIVCMDDINSVEYK